MQHAITKQYADFVRGMWQDNCVERDAYKEPQLSYEKYSRENHSFLEEKFYEYLSDNMIWDEKILDYREA